ATGATHALRCHHRYGYPRYLVCCLWQLRSTHQHFELRLLAVLRSERFWPAVRTQAPTSACRTFRIAALDSANLLARDHRDSCDRSCERSAGDHRGIDRFGRRDSRLYRFAVAVFVRPDSRNDRHALMNIRVSPKAVSGTAALGKTMGHLRLSAPGRLRKF